MAPVSRRTKRNYVKSGIKMKERERECDRDRGMGREIERESESPFFVSSVFTSTSAVEKLPFLLTM